MTIRIRLQLMFNISVSNLIQRETIFGQTCYCASVNNIEIVSKRSSITLNSYFALKAPFRVGERALTDVCCPCGGKEQKLRGRTSSTEERKSGISTLIELKGHCKKKLWINEHRILFQEFLVPSASSKSNVYLLTKKEM